MLDRDTQYPTQKKVVKKELGCQIMEHKEERLSRAISASSRRKILRLLFTGEKTVKAISRLTGISVSLASRHLKMLYDLGFLSVRVKFPNKFYSLRIKDLKGLLDAYDKVISKI